MSETGESAERAEQGSTGEVCQLVWMDFALHPLSRFELLLRRARIRTLGLLRRIGVLEYSPLDAHMAPPWRRPPALATVGARPGADSSGGPGSASGGKASGSARRETGDGPSDSPGGPGGAQDAPPTKRRAFNRAGGLQAGDLVRVRPLDEIAAMLDDHHRYDGLSFMRPMAEHCGKTHRVFKKVRRLVNDRDHTVRKARGVVILDGVFCHGRGVYGREDCDRTCFFFWKEEWLEKVDE